jgi:hypothetical protein
MRSICEFLSVVFTVYTISEIDRTLVLDITIENKRITNRSLTSTTSRHSLNFSPHVYILKNFRQYRTDFSCAHVQTAALNSAALVVPLTLRPRDGPSRRTESTADVPWPPAANIPGEPVRAGPRDAVVYFV